jgi:hypothetical protein
MKDWKFDNIEKQAMRDSIIYTASLALAGYLVYKILANLSHIEAFFA